MRGLFAKPEWDISPNKEQKDGPQAKHSGFSEQRGQLLEFGMAEMAYICKVLERRELCRREHP